MLDFRSIPVILKAAVLLLLLLGFTGREDSSAQDSEQEKSVSLLFVVTGSSGSLTGDELTLRDVSSVIFFSDRPERLAGQLSIEEFLDMWELSDFSTVPPNADLNARSHRGDEVNAVYVLTKVSSTVDGLRFAVEQVNGSKDTITGELTNPALFVDLDATQCCPAGLSCCL